MCTTFAIIKKDGTAQLADRLGVPENKFFYSQCVRPGNTISIIIGSKGGDTFKEVIWWLYLKQTGEELKPEYQSSRCIIPATAFVECQKGKNPHPLESQDGRCMAFGGLFRQKQDKTTNERI